MIPTFGRIFGEPIPAYFALLMVGFGTATFLAARWAKRSGLDHDVIIDLGLISVLAGVAGGRLLHVFADGYFWDYVHLCTDPSLVVWHTVNSAAECTELSGRWNAAEGQCHAVERNCFAWAEFWNGGLAYYGGLIAASGTGIWFLRRERFPVGKGCDIVGATIPLGIFFGRLGCFFGGCCFGVVTDSPFGMRFPGHSPASEMHFREDLLGGKHLPSLPVHATQLYEALGCLAIAAFLGLWLHPRKRFDGQVLLAFLMLYAALRFLIEFWRDDDRGALAGMSTSQFIGVLIVIGCAFFWRQRRAQPAARA
ncbi:MAG: prolipoprotein diacylglyceryl transferase [Myxococcales bacterium]|nr:prolipoprotein diacylglyceryl transferase [Myxococcales bacterium]